ncbi:MAG: DUF927 domain-containing protein [Thiocapsa sp.]|uniref:DUF927 domain-containing protein n=1 Tax=Thiocapsa sp. TaxID=2024551 RepID=UPI001BCA804A|nr:DUF927 domain-containing protein [Thiocapsa sp.]QVL46751.1 MAG: DUF927 domain-containing protein [Thiocapsa sp.]
MAGAAKRRPGVYYHGVEEDLDDKKKRVDLWLCSPLILDATTFDRRGESYGRLLRFRDVRGRWHEWNCPMYLLRGSCEELRGELLGLGLEIDHKARGRLPNYLMHRAPKREVIAALSLGWHDDTFVFPDEAIGPTEIRYQSESATIADFDQRGTLAEWRDSVSVLASDNTVMTLAISASFAGPLLARVHMESCGLHFHGDSSGGKTTAVQAAVSVWGSRDMLRTWRGTNNGLEAAAAESTDTMLSLDEINEANGKEIGAIVYALANGRGKSRATRSGGARRIARWRTVVLSTGEKTLEARMAEDGARHHAGQDVRLLNVPTDGRRYGTFDSIHGRDSARAFADEIKTSSGRYYGTAGRAFVRYLVANIAEDFGAMVKTLTDRMPATEGQEARVARQFALIGTAGELATTAGITGWVPGAATKSAMDAFVIWRDARGKGNVETTKILSAVRDFIERYGDLRFTDSSYPDARPLRGDRAGYTRVIDGRVVYMLTPGGLGEAIKGFDRARALDALDAAGWLLYTSKGTKGERRTQSKIGGRNVGLYSIQLPDDENVDVERKEAA